MSACTKAIAALTIVLILVAGCGVTEEESASVSPTATLRPPTSTPLPATAIPTETATPVPTETITPAPTGTVTPVPTETSTPVPTETITPAPTAGQATSGSTSYVPAFEPDICHFSPPYGYEVECGYLVVPENRGKQDSPSIRIHAAIFKSTSENPKPDPVIYVAGGGGVNQLSSAEHYLNRGGNDILQDRDYIMYNQRGAHLNEPSLVCPDETNLFWSLAKQGLSPHEKADRRIERRLACHDTLIERGIDLTGYNTVETAADVNDLRIALGYDEVNLYGTSSGTRTILTIMRNHPEGIRSVILDSVYPPQVGLYSTVSLSAHRVFSLLFEECAADPVCSQAYPDLEATFYQTVDDLNATPAKVQLSRGPVLVDGGLFMDAVYLSFYSTSNIPQLPAWIDAASQGDFRGLQNTIEWMILSDTGTFIAIGFEWSLQCNEEVPFESYELGRELAADLPAQIAEYYDSYYEFTLCESWQAGQADPVENTAVVSDIPALILAGQFDPVTPPEWGQLAGETLSNHTFYEFPGLGHGIMRSNECGLEIGLQFLEDPTSEPDASCVDELTGPDFN
jgi:pimeloyl-ACP methyl ester carboxylesterase